MPKIRRVRTRTLTGSGEKEYCKAVITIPKILLQLLRWDYGDEIEFDIDTKDSRNRHMDIRKASVR